jgi:hypothetical protein
MAQHVVSRGEVEIHLAGILRFEVAYLEVDDHEAAEPEIVKQEVDAEVLAADLEEDTGSGATLFLDYQRIAAREHKVNPMSGRVPLLEKGGVRPSGLVSLGEPRQAAALNVLGKLPHTLGRRDSVSFTTRQRRFGLIDNGQYFDPPAFALSPQGNGLTYRIFFTVKASALNSITDKRLLL